MSSINIFEKSVSSFFWPICYVCIRQSVLYRTDIAFRNFFPETSSFSGENNYKIFALQKQLARFFADRRTHASTHACNINWPYACCYALEVYNSFGRCTARTVLVRIDCEPMAAAKMSATRRPRSIGTKTIVAAPQRPEALYSSRSITTFYAIHLSL